MKRLPTVRTCMSALGSGWGSICHISFLIGTYETSSFWLLNGVGIGREQMKVLSIYLLSFSLYPNLITCPDLPNYPWYKDDSYIGKRKVIGECTVDEYGHLRSVCSMADVANNSGKEEFNLVMLGHSSLPLSLSCICLQERWVCSE